MRATLSNWPASDCSRSSGSRPIAIGLGIVLFAACVPHIPIVTGMALIALGATTATRERFHRMDLLRIVMVGHLVTYTGLYLLFVAATCHALMTPAFYGIGFVRGLDLAASVIPMAIVLRQSLAAILGGGDAPAH